MKKTLLSLVILIMTYSCNNTNKQDESKVKESNISSIDSALPLLNVGKRNEINKQAKTDSLKQAKIDSIALIAWGDAKFGMSRKNVKKTLAFMKATFYNEKNSPFSFLTLYSPNIDGIYSVNATFFNDRLYRIDMESSEKTANYYDTEIKETVSNLKYLIEKKYGSPTEELGFPSFLKMKPDKKITAYSWNIGEKYIGIDVGEVYSGSKYKVECAIIHYKESEPASEYNSKKTEIEEAKKINGF